MVLRSYYNIMRYFVKKSKPSKKGLYLQIYRTNYVPGKGNQNKSYKALGYVSDLIKQGIEDPIKYAQELVDKLNASHEIKKERQIGDVSTQTNIGYFLPKSMFSYLDMDKDLNIIASSFKCHYKFSELFKTLVYAQIIGPGSKHYLYDKTIPSLHKVGKYSYDQILDCVNFVGSDFHKYIEILNHHIENKYSRNFNKCYFDCTNYYFEIDEEDDFRKKGPSKENRKSPIIGQSLLLDADMIPLDMELYPGNESERPYLRKRIEDMKSRNNVSGRIIQIADKGLNCARNIYAASIEANDGYIFSKSVHGKNLTDTEKVWVLLNDEDANKWTEVRGPNNELLYRYKECIDTFSYSCKVKADDEKETKFTVKEKRIVTYNPSLAKKQRREIQKMVDRLQQKITYKEIVREELGDAVKYVTIEAKTIEGEKVKIAKKLNQDKINEDLSFAGYNLLVTSEINASPTEIYNAYHNLWRIENSFRVMKTLLDARPAYVSTKETVFGHFLIVYVALTIMRLIELKVFVDEIPIDQLFSFIRDYNITENYDGTFINNATSSHTYLKIKDKYQLSKLGNVYLTDNDVNNILKATF